MWSITAIVTTDKVLSAQAGNPMVALSLKSVQKKACLNSDRQLRFQGKVAFQCIM